MPVRTQDDEIRLVEQEWNECISRRDASAAQEFMADDYLLVGVRSTGAAPVGRADGCRH
jgi:ketosteroid isomerase-like protein